MPKASTNCLSSSLSCKIFSSVRSSQKSRWQICSNNLKTEFKRMSLTPEQLNNFSLNTFVIHSYSLHCALLSWFHLPSDGENLVLLPLLFWPHPAQLARDRQGWKDINVDKCSCNPVFKPCSPSKKDSLPSSRSKRKGDQGQRWSRGEPSIGSARAWWWCK